MKQTFARGRQLVIRPRKSEPVSAGIRADAVQEALGRVDLKGWDYEQRTRRNSQQQSRL